MEGQFWALVGRDNTSGRVPGAVIGSNPAGPTAAVLIHYQICDMWRYARPAQGRAETSVAISANTASPYNFPTDFLDWLPNEPPTINGLPLELKTRGEVRQLAAAVTQNGTPCVFYELGTNPASTWRRRFGVWPTPSAAFTLYLDYLRQPIALSVLGNTDEYPDLLPDFHLTPCFGAAYTFYQNNPELPRPDAWKSWGDRYQREKAQSRLAMRQEMGASFRGYIPSVMTSAVLDAWMPAE